MDKKARTSQKETKMFEDITDQSFITVKLIPGRKSIIYSSVNMCMCGYVYGSVFVIIAEHLWSTHTISTFKVICYHSKSLLSYRVM